MLTYQTFFYAWLQIDNYEEGLFSAVEQKMSILIEGKKLQGFTTRS